MMHVGAHVYDRWWPWRVGIVRAVLKTRVKVDYGTEVWTYDRAHMQFLEAL